MKTDRILSTAGVCRIDSTKLRSYCNLMQGSLIDKWLFADDFVDSHVCFVRDDYLDNMNLGSLHKAQVVVILRVANIQHLDYEYQISTPLTALKIKNVLNQISNSYEFKPFKLNITEPKKSVNRFKSAFKRIRKNFFGKQGLDAKQVEQSSKQRFISRITKTMNIHELPSFKIVLLGSPGSGKTTAIETISNGKALKSDVSATDSVASDKSQTTVGIDYAEIKISGSHNVKNRKVTLIGTPGQIKYNFIWDMVGKTANAFIILLDMSRPEPLSYLKFFNNFLNKELGKKSQIYCALTHCDKYNGCITSIVDCIGVEFPKLRGIYKMDAREQYDVTTIVEDIYPQIEEEDEKNSVSYQISGKGKSATGAF